MKTLIRWPTVITICMIVTLNSIAQSPKVKEFGVGLTGLHNFSLQYRWGTEAKLFRITGNFGAANITTEESTSNTNFSSDPSTTFSNSKTTSPVNFSIGGAFSIIHLKAVTEKFGFVYGPHVGMSYSYQNLKKEDDEIGNFQRTTTMKPMSTQFFAGLVIGGYYKVSESFRIYAEITPNLYYNIYSSTTNVKYIDSFGTQESNSDRSRNSFGLSGISNNGANITFAYRITYPVN